MPLNCISSDISALLSPSDFGVEGGAILNGDTANPIQGIFDDEDIETQNGEGVTVLVRQAMFTCSSSDVPNLTEGNTFFINGAEYIVRATSNDGTGIVEAYLERFDLASLSVFETDIYEAGVFQ